MKKCIVLGAGVVTVSFVAFVGAAGYLLWQGASLAAQLAQHGLEQTRGAIERAAPVEAREEVHRHIERAMAALRGGQLDMSVLSEAAWWLPGVLADGRLDADETRALHEKLDRLAPGGLDGLVPGEGTSQPAAEAPSRTS